MKFSLIIPGMIILITAAPAYAQPTAESIIAQVDRNNDMAIDKAEWDTLGAPIEFPAEGDTNNDGKLDIAELQALFERFRNGGAPQPPQNPPPQPSAGRGGPAPG